jgi:site-specific recombinase XerC
VSKAWPRHRPDAGGTPLWRSQKGGRLSAAAMRRTIDGLVADGARRGLVPPEAAAHTLRHTFAAHHLQAHPGDLLGLLALLGHASLDTTRLYAGPTAAQLAARVDRLALNAYAG